MIKVNKRFIEVWTGNYSPLPNEDHLPFDTNRDMDDYNESEGYRENDIQAIDSLEVGEQYNTDDGNTIIRIK
jgi:hypothetical protein